MKRKDNDVLRFITHFLEAQGKGENYEYEQEIIRRQFRAGYSLYFAHMLQYAFGRGTVCWAAPYAHFVWVDDDGIPYDIEGKYMDEYRYLIPESYLGDVIRDFKHMPGDEHPMAGLDEKADILWRYKRDRLKKFIRTEIDRSSMVLDEGIHETGALYPGITFGCSYESDDEGKPVYIYNLFVDGEYVNVCGCGTPVVPLPDDVLKELVDLTDRFRRRKV